MARYEIILLDADMTLLDFARSQRGALSRTLEKWGLPDSEETQGAYHKINSALWDAMARGEIDQDFLVIERFSALLRLLGADADPCRLNHDYECFLGEEAYLLPGAMEFCQTLSQTGLTLALATNGLPRAQRGRYVRTGLDQVIPNLFISMELGASKPNPRFFQNILEKLSATDPSRVVMIGDGLATDILGANRANIDSIWFDPQNEPLTGAAQPTWIAHSYDEILDILEIR